MNIHPSDEMYKVGGGGLGQKKGTAIWSGVQTSNTVVKEKQMCSARGTGRQQKQWGMLS